MINCSGVGRFHVSYSASISNHHHTTVSTMSACSRLQQLYTGCVPTLGGGLPCHGVGRVGVFMNRLITGCIPALGGGLLCPGVGRVGVSMNRSVTGCVPVFGGGLPCPGVGRVGEKGPLERFRQTRLFGSSLVPFLGSSMPK